MKQVSESTQEEQGLFKKWVDVSLSDPERIYRLLFYLAVGNFIIISLFPIYWLFTIAVTPPAEVTNIEFLPAGFNLGVFGQTFETIPFHWYLFNSFVIAGISTIIVIIVGSLAGYAFGRLEFPGRRPLLLLFLTISYFPGVAFLLPLFRLFTGNVEILGFQSPVLFNTPGALVLPFSALFLPFTTYILTNYYQQIPDGLEDAARIEGSTRLGALVRVIAPLSKPGIVTAGVITFIVTYNEFFFSFIFTDGQAENWSPMLWGIIVYQSRYSTQYHLMAAASLIALIPVVLLVLVAQRHIVGGLTGGALKG